MVLELKDDTFDKEVREDRGVVLLDFWAPWCGPCRAMGPIVDALAAEYAGKVKVCKMNVDESPSTPGRYGIRAIPTLMLFKAGEVVGQLTGAVSKTTLKDLISKHLPPAA